MSRLVLEISKEEDSTASLDNFASHPHGKEMFPDVQKDISVFQFMPIISYPVNDVLPLCTCTPTFHSIQVFPTSKTICTGYWNV